MKASSNQGTSRVRHHRILHQAKIVSEVSALLPPIAFYSQDTHYSVIKAMRVLNISTFNDFGSGKYKCPLVYPHDYPNGYSKHYLDKNGWPLEVPSDEYGSIYIPALKKLVGFFASKKHPILVNFNFGSTFKGSYDNVGVAINELIPILKKYKMYQRKIEYRPKRYAYRTGFWFHVDGALGAAYMPFFEMISKQSINFRDFEFPIFDFRIKELHSISMSGHKWIGSPWPCGIYMTKVKYQLQPPDDPMYIGSPDSTFAGSRNGFSPLILWDYLSRNSYEDLKKKALFVDQLLYYTKQEFDKLTLELGIDLWVEYSPLSLTIRFKQPNPDIIFKYSLSCEALYVNNEKRSYSHIFIMESANKDKIDSLITDLKNPNAFLK